MTSNRFAAIVPTSTVTYTESEQVQNLRELERFDKLKDKIGDLRVIMRQVETAARWVPDVDIEAATNGCAEGIAATLTTINGLRQLLRFGEFEDMAVLRGNLKCFIDALQMAPRDGGRRLREVEKELSGFSETLDKLGRRQGAKTVSQVNMRLAQYGKRFKYDFIPQTRGVKGWGWNDAARACMAHLEEHPGDLVDREVLNILRTYSTDPSRGDYFRKNYHDHKAELAPD